MTAIALLVEKVLPYLVALVLGVGLGGYAVGVHDGAKLAKEQAAHEKENAANAQRLAAISAAAAAADAKALADHTAAEGRITTLDDQLTKEKTAHENDSRAFAAQLAAGTQRLRVAVTSCSHSRSDGVPAPASTPGVDDGGPAYADLDPTVASRVFTVAGDDQREIDKLTALQGYVCAIRPDLPACAATPARAAASPADSAPPAAAPSR